MKEGSDREAKNLEDERGYVFELIDGFHRGNGDLGCRVVFWWCLHGFGSTGSGSRSP